MGNADDPDLDRYRTLARRTASQRSLYTVESSGGILPTHHHLATKTPKPQQAGGLSTIHGRDASPSASPAGPGPTGGGQQLHGVIVGDEGRGSEKSTHNDVEDSISEAAPPPAPPPHKSEDACSGDPAIDAGEENKKSKLPITTRMKEGCKRFGRHTKDALTHSWVNILLVFVPVGIAARAANLNPGAVFGINAIAIVPLAGLLTHATESVASRLGDTWGALLNVTFGNSVELIIFIIALVKNEIRIVQASIMGSILANLLLILGMAFLFGGLLYREQIYNNTVTQMSACLLSISVVSLLLPTAFHASFKQANLQDADNSVLKVSRGTSVILLIVYVLYLAFQLGSHKHMYESTPQQLIDEESHPGVLADFMNSSSSESSSSSSSSDSDSSDSGSIVNKAKKVKRMFTKHRKSSASIGSSVTGPEKLSSLSSPSTQENEDPMQHPFRSYATSRRESNVMSPTSDEADADHEDNGVSRNFDWATNQQLSNANSPSPEPTKRRKKHTKKDKKKKKHRRKNEQQAEAAKDSNDAPSQPRVEFADEVAVLESPQPSEQQSTAQPSTPRMTFNMRQLSSRARPGLSKMLSNTVFMQPPPNAQPAQRPVLPRSQSAGSYLRRTSSLPDRLSRQPQVTEKADPLPPFQHKRFPAARKAASEMAAVVEKTENDEEQQMMSRTAACVLLAISTGLVAACAEFMVDAIPAMIGDGNTVSEAFIGLIILPIVGNAAEHVTAVTVAVKNKVDLAIAVAVGSSIQIALFVTPLVVLIGWIANTDMSLYFNLFETVSLFVTVFVVNFLVLDGRSNYLEGALLMAAYVIIALVSFFYPSVELESTVGGGSTGT